MRCEPCWNLIRHLQRNVELGNTSGTLLGTLSGPYSPTPKIKTIRYPKPIGSHQKIHLEPYIRNRFGHRGIMRKAPPACPETFTMAEDPKLPAVGKSKNQGQFTVAWTRHPLKTTCCLEQLNKKHRNEHPFVTSSLKDRPLQDHNQVAVSLTICCLMLISCNRLRVAISCLCKSALKWRTRMLEIKIAMVSFAIRYTNSTVCR